MKRLLVAALLLGGLGLAGCQSEKEGLDASKPIDKMTTEEWCGFYQKYLASPNVTPATRKLDKDRMRARGCPNIPA